MIRIFLLAAVALLLLLFAGPPPKNLGSSPEQEAYRWLLAQGFQWSEVGTLTPMYSGEGAVIGFYGAVVNLTAKSPNNAAVEYKFSSLATPHRARQIVEFFPVSLQGKIYVSLTENQYTYTGLCQGVPQGVLICFGAKNLTGFFFMMPTANLFVEKAP